MKPLVLIVLISMLYHISPLFAESITPNHEASIIMIEVQNKQIYTLDYNGLLLIRNLHSGQVMHTVPVKTHIRTAYFHFPYIVMIDIDNIMYVYDIEKRFIPYSSQFLDEEGYASFSKDTAIFAYTGQEQVHIINTKSWNTISTYANETSPTIFLFISLNKQNLMSYHSNGDIIYRSVANGEILKSIQSEVALKKIILNNTLRFGTGYANKSLISIDLISGEIRDSIFFTQNILDIYETDRTDDAMNITVVNKEGDNTERTTLFSLLDTGHIKENDLFSINIPKQTSAITSSDASIYVGFVDGEVWSYKKNIRSSPKHIISSDNTLAIYDAIYHDNNLLLSTIEGILPVDINTTNKNTDMNTANNNSILEITSTTPTLINQPLQNPSFVINQSISSSPLFVLSNTIPYAHLINTTDTTTASNNEKNNTIETDGISLLFSFASSSSLSQKLAQQPTQELAPRLVKPIPFENNIHTIQKFDAVSIVYSALQSHLYIKQDGVPDITIPLLSPNIYFEYYEDTLWTTAPLLNTEINLENNINILYSYTIGDTLQSASDPIALSFIQGAIQDFKIIDKNTFLVTGSNKAISNKSSTETSATVFYIETNNGDGENLENKMRNKGSVLYPHYVQPLFQINGDTLQKVMLIPPPKKDKEKEQENNIPNTNKLLIITKTHLHIVSINTEEKKLHFVHTTRIPDTLGIIINANIQAQKNQTDKKTQSPQNERASGQADAQEYLLTIVDKNNVVSLFTFDDNTMMQYQKSLVVHNDFTVSLY